MINWHHQTSKIWPQSYRIPEFHSEGWEMLNYRNHNLIRSNVGHMLKRIAGLPDTETQETFPLLKGVRGALGSQVITITSSRWLLLRRSLKCKVKSNS